ncbi:MAG: alpha/beta fold hydrolase [Acidimicrobiales bacterium]|nr:alpha/beta fold hydrolase [Acidimicrobiales bacterium]MCB9394538.1 alpha/beta fold hydrolase [Acidimicrobiaceae bacterium]
MSTLQVGNATVGYGEEGAGPPVLVFHGTTMNRTAWDMVRAEMHASYRWVMVEFPGSGESSMPAGPIEVGDLVAQAVAVADHLGIERFHVAGYSLGAVAALATAADAPDRVLSCTSLSGWATTDARMRFTFGLWRQLIATSPELFMRYAVADGFTAGAIAALEPMLEGVIAMGASTLAPGSDAHLELDERVDIADRLGAITAPTLVIGGIEDRWVDIVHSRAIADAVGGARLEEVPFGHLVIQEGAAVVAALLAAHLESAGGAA